MEDPFEFETRLTRHISAVREPRFIWKLFCFPSICFAPSSSIEGKKASPTGQNFMINSKGRRMRRSEETSDQFCTQIFNIMFLKHIFLSSSDIFPLEDIWKWLLCVCGLCWSMKHCSAAKCTTCCTNNNTATLLYHHQHHHYHHHHHYHEKHHHYQVCTNNNTASFFYHHQFIIIITTIIIIIINILLSSQSSLSSLSPSSSLPCTLGLGEIGLKDPNFKIKTCTLGFPQEIEF